jgi:hypothetical protein
MTEGRIVHSSLFQLMTTQRWIGSARILLVGAITFFYWRRLVQGQRVWNVRPPGPPSGTSESANSYSRRC